MINLPQSGGAGGTPHAKLSGLQADFALSVQDVGPSIGGPGRLDAGHPGCLYRLDGKARSRAARLAWAECCGGGISLWAQP